jgi:DNA-binding CsgD family transcriptional regulator
VTHDLAKRYRGNQKPVSDYLTTREREVLKLIAEGKSSKETAELLFISVRTVEHHRENIKRKLGLKKLSDLVRYAITKGYTSVNA